MNVFVLNTGRCGSTSFIQACRHITNYTALHESRVNLIGKARLSYPDNHIEADNRLSWLLGRLDREYADNAFYVHLVRDSGKTAASFTRRRHFGIMQAYTQGILLGGPEDQSPHAIALDYIDTVEANIALFLKDKGKGKTMEFNLTTAKSDFESFWNRIRAEGDLQAALNEWDVIYNASSTSWSENSDVQHQT